MISRVRFAIVSSFLLAVTAAHALEAGDNFAALGVAGISTSLATTSLNYSGNVVLPGPTLVPGPLPISSANASGSNTAVLILGHMFTDHFALVLDVGYPPKTDLYMSQPILTRGASTQIASVNLWSPMVVGRYYFLDKSSSFRPYLGAGATYSRFQSLTLTSAGQSLAPNGASLDSSIGWVASMGFNYDFTNTRYFLTGSLSYTQTRTTMHVNNLADPAHTGPAATTPIRMTNSIGFFGFGCRF